MYIHLGGDFVVAERDIIGIFDLENTTVSKHTRDFLNKSEKRKEVVYTSFELPKSFVVATNKDNNKVYISQISPVTLNKRLGLNIK